MYCISKSHRRSASLNSLSKPATVIDQQKMVEYITYYTKFSQILHKQNRHLRNIQYSYQHSSQIDVDDIFQDDACWPRTPFSLGATKDEDNTVYMDREEDQSTKASKENKSDSIEQIQPKQNSACETESFHADEDLCLDEDEKSVDSSSKMSSNSSSNVHTPISPLEQILSQNLHIKKNISFGEANLKQSQKQRCGMYHQRGKSMSFLDKRDLSDEEHEEEEEDDHYVLTTILESSVNSKKKASSLKSRSQEYNSTPRNMAATGSYRRHNRNQSVPFNNFKNKKNSFKMDTSRYQDLFACNLLAIQEKKEQMVEHQNSLEIVHV